MFKCRKDRQSPGILAEAVLVVLFMPIAGLYLMRREDAAACMFGKVLFVFGGLFWTLLGIVQTASVL